MCTVYFSLGKIHLSLMALLYANPRNAISSARRLGGHFGNGGTRENGEHGPLGLDPNRMRGTVGFSRAGPAGNHADVEADGAVDGLNHVKHRCRAATRRNAKAARLPAPRGDEPGARQCLQDLGEEAFRRARGLGQRGKRDAPIGGRAAS